MPTRRRLLSLTATALALPLIPRRAFAHQAQDLGRWRLDMLSDGHLDLPRGFVFGGVPDALVDRTVARHGLDGDALTSPCNITLLRGGDDVVLVDAGAGPDFMASAGRLPEALEELGLAPDDITHLILTHGHPDHLWGVLDDFDEPAFPRAQVMMGAVEHAYWTDPATAGTIGEDRASFAAGAARRLALLKGVVLFDDGDDLLPGIRARMTPGHTPGHMSLMIDGDRPAIVLGDAVGNGHLALDAPDQPAPSDQDPETARDTRLSLLRDIADHGLLVAGFHLPGGGLGTIAADGAGYRFDALA